MRNKDLKTGMLVETRGGHKGIVLCNFDNTFMTGERVISFPKDEIWERLDEFTPRLKFKKQRSLTKKEVRALDIMRVWSASSVVKTMKLSTQDRLLLWERA